MAKKKGDGLDGYRMVEIEKIDPPSGQVRIDIPQERIVGLAENISEQGLFNPILLKGADGRFEVIQGHRRLLAYKYLKLKEIPAKVVKMDKTTVALARASENIQRDDLSPIEEGAIYQDLSDNHGMNYEMISKRMGKSPHVVKRRLDLMKMPAVLQQAIHSRQISPTVGEELWCIKDDAAIDYYLSFAIDNGATKEVVRSWVKDHQSKVRAAQLSGAEGSPPVSPMEPTKTYVPCEACNGPLEIGTETTLRVCGECGRKIFEALK